jgi:hypothetical protein
MSTAYPHLKKITHSDTHIAVPIAGLMTEVLDRHKAITQSLPSFKVVKVPLKQKHTDATRRIATCTGYLVTIHDRLFDESAPKRFMDKQLDWESLRIYTQVILDSFAVLVPVFYGVTAKYSGVCPTCKVTEKNDSVNSFNQLAQWVKHHKLDDEFTKRYAEVKERSSWYGSVNADRNHYIHKRTTPDIVGKQTIGGHTIEKTLLIKMNPKPLEPATITTIEEEAELLLKSLFDFMAFSSEFFVSTLTAQGCVVSEVDQYKYNLIFDDLKPFNTTVFGEKS